eukprot:gene23376-29590_t
MPSDKTKVKDSLSNVGNLKDQLNSVFKQIKLFQSRIDEMKNSSREEDLGYMRSFDLENRCNMLQSCHKSGKDPSKAAIFLTRTIVSSLCGGPLSERDIKTIVVDKCLELGIKSTNRGTIAGLNLEVSTVCSVLASIGVLEATCPIDAPSTDGLSVNTSSHVRGFGEELCDSITTRWEADITRYLAEFKRPDPVAVQDTLTSPAFKAEISSSSFYPPPQSGSELNSTSFDTSLMLDHDLSLMQSFDAQQDHSLLDLTSGSIGGMDGLTDHSFSEHLLNMTSPSPHTSSSGYFPRHSLLQDDADMFASLASPLLSPPVTTSSSGGTGVHKRVAHPPVVMASLGEESVSGNNQEADDLLMASLRDYLGGEGEEEGEHQVQEGEEDIHDSSFVLSMLGDEDSPSHPVDNNNNLNITNERERTLSEDSIQMARDLLFHSGGGGGGGSDLEGTTPAANSPLGEDEGLSLNAALNDSDLMDSLMLLPSSSPSPPAPSQQQHTTSSSTTGAGGGAGVSPSPSTTSGPVHFKMEMPDTPCSSTVTGGHDFETESVCVSVQSSIINNKTGKAKGGGSKAKGNGGNGAKEGKLVGSGRRSAAVTRVWRIRSDLNDQLRRFVESSSGSEPFKHVLLQPSPVLSEWSTSSSNAAAASEIEENLLRRLAGQCGLVLKTASYRLGTRYLDVNYQEPVQEVTAQSGFEMDCSAMSSQVPVNGLERQSSYASMASGDSTHSANMTTSSAAGGGGGNRSRSGSNSSASNAVFVGGVQALYDESVSITGSFLLDKIRRSKRQRGASLTSNGLTAPVFNSSHLSTLNAICNNTASGYWEDSLKYAVSVTATSSAPSSSSGKGGGVGVKGSKAGGGAHGNKGGLDVSALAGAHYPKHYSQPSLLVPYRGQGPPLVKFTSPVTNSNSGSGSGSTTSTAPLILSAIHLPDLSVYSQEIPWSTIAKEFTVLGGEEAGAVFKDSHSHNNQSGGDHSASHSKAGGGSVSKGSGSGGALSRTVSKDNSTATTEKHPNQYTNKKKNLQSAATSSSSGSSGLSTVVLSRSESSQSNTTAEPLKKTLTLQLPVYDVAAPMFREVIPPSRTPSALPCSTEVENEVEEEEDISDEAVLARHDAVLRAMREKWALLQALKNEHSRRGSGGDYVSQKKNTSGGHNQQGAVLLTVSGGEDGNGAPIHYSGSGSHMKYKKYLHTTNTSQGGVAMTGSSGDGSSSSDQQQQTSNKKRGHNMMSGGGGGGSDNLKRRGRPPKVTKTVHTAGSSTNVVLGVINPLSAYPGHVSQRGNNQYTAIRAAAAQSFFDPNNQESYGVQPSYTCAINDNMTVISSLTPNSPPVDEAVSVVVMAVLKDATWQCALCTLVNVATYL